MFKVKDECIEIVEQVDRILRKYKVNKDDRDTIKDIIETSYYKLSDAYACGRVLERMLSDNGINYDLKQYLEMHMEEMEKFPFDIN